VNLSKKHTTVLDSIFSIPTKSNIVWKEIESLLEALGAELTEGNGSRVRIVLNEVRAVFHRPHPRKEADKGAIVSMRRFLTTAGVQHV
jgi:hypothetical protein